MARDYQKIKVILDNYLTQSRKLISRHLNYFVLIGILSLICTMLNYDATNMSGILPHYYDFSDFIRSGFNMNLKFHNNQYTYPMWGYGFVFAITKSKLIIVICQQLFTLATLGFIIMSLRKLDINGPLVVDFKALTFLALSWFFFHSVLWPYSISANLLLCSIFALILYLQLNKLKYLILSASLYGLMLNFRSDYYFLQFILFFIIIMFQNKKKLSARTSVKAILWLLIVQMLLIPWGIYTYKRTNHYLTTSTNGGHVIFIALGQLPNNLWHITPRDDDPEMHRIVKEKLGDHETSLSFLGDSLLKREWFRRVASHPLEYWKKIMYGACLYATRPFYIGQISRNMIVEDEFQQFKEVLLMEFEKMRIGAVFNVAISKGVFVFVVIAAMNLLGVGIVLAFFVYLLKYVRRVGFVILNDSFAIIILCTMFYQICFQLISLYGANYDTNIFLLYLMMIAYLRRTMVINDLRYGSKHLQVIE